MRAGVVLTSRDRDLLKALGQFRVLTTEQVRRLAFPSTQTALRRLRQLEAAKLLRCTASPVLESRIVTLTRAGLESIRGNGDGGGLRPSSCPRPLFLRHVLAVNDLRLALQDTMRTRSEIELLGFMSDRDRETRGVSLQPRPLLSVEMALGARTPVRHVPDAAFVLRRGDRTAQFLAEIDLGTEVIGNDVRGVGKAIRFYLQGLSVGAFASLGDVLPGAAECKTLRVLFLTTSPRRLQGIRRTWGGRPFEPEIAKRFIWLGTLDALAGDELHRWPWVSLDPSDTTPYTIAPEEQC